MARLAHFVLVRGINQRVVVRSCLFSLMSECLGLLAYTAQRAP